MYRCTVLCKNELKYNRKQLSTKNRFHNNGFAVSEWCSLAGGGRMTRSGRTGAQEHAIKFFTHPL